MTFVKRLGSGSLAALLSLALHALLLVPLVSVTRGAARPAAEPVGVLLALSDPSLPAEDRRMDLPSALTDVSLPDAPSAIEFGAPQVDLHLDEETDAQTPDVVPSYVRYMGQVTARIQRLWAVPIARPVAEFHCRARIQRGPAGEVVDLTLQPCDDDATLQASVRKAIRLAAPLPTHPDAETSAEILTLDFSVFAANAEGRSSSVQPGS